MSDPFEDRLRNQLGDMMLRAMDNKAEILAELLANMDTLPKMGRGLANFEQFCEEIESLAELGETELLGEKMSPRAMAQMIRVLSKTCRIQSKMILHLACFALIYGNGNSYDGDASAAAMKFGKGDEALRAMIRSRFGPNGPFGGKK